jgi:D-alanyl-D-alanine carboxypeptidase/D-alanyl-D-alanine-endopeptidase (penicillin-binding protein 4)
MPNKCVALGLLLLTTAIARADDLADHIQAITDAKEFKPARWGILVVDAESGRTVYEHNPDKLVLPASVTKLFTCATALCELGADHRFTTPVLVRGKINDKVLDGDLILVASGDLTFGGRRGKDGHTCFADNDHTYANGGLFNAQLTDTDPLFALNDLARQVAEKVKEVKGDVLIDDRLFPRTRSSGSGPDVVAPILVNDNVVDVTVAPGEKDGDPAVVKVQPESAFLQVDADVRTVKKGGRPSITIESTGTGQFAVRGRIPAGSSPTVRIVAIDDPTIWARALFIEALRRHGVKVEASLYRPRRSDMPDPGAHLDKVAEYKSEPLADVVKVTLKVSHNLYASTLPVLVGLKHGGNTAGAGLRRQAQVLRTFGVDPGSVCFAGGAGGANADSVTPRATVDLLRAMARHKAAKEYFDALPILGVDGTLAEAVSKESPARGKVRAKTGTLGWDDLQNARAVLRSKALAGELETARGTKLFVAMFLNDLPLNPGVTTASQGKVLGKLCEEIYKYGP